MAANMREQKLHPKLRMIRNGDDAVNAVRAECSPLVASTLGSEALVPATELMPMLAAGFRAPGSEAAFAAAAEPAPREPLAGREARHAYVGVFIEVHRDRQVGGASATAAEVDALKSDVAAMFARAPGAQELDRCMLSKRNFIAATIPVAELAALAADERVAFVHPAEPIAFELPPPQRGLANDVKPTDRAVAGKEHKGGRGVIIGIIDVGGFDFAHPDFLDGQRTRFLSIWDQGGRGHRPPSVRRGAGFEAFDFGSEIQKKEMDEAIAAAKAGKPPATLLEPQSQMSRSSHATHVASIAAGNSGVCPKADIAAVLLNVPFDAKDPEERRRTFTDSTRIMLAVEYLLEVARKAGKPISINISLGTNGGAHDGSGGVSRWLDAVLAAEGRSICVAAGNAGQEAPTEESPSGWIVGRIHASGKIASRGLVVDLDWTVVGDGTLDVSENELEIWYSPQDRLRIAVKPPGNAPWIEVGPREYVENKRLPGGTFISIYNELFNPVNGANYCAVYLSPDLRPQNLAGVQAGTWTVRLIGDEIRNGEFHCWIERDDPYEFAPIQGRRVARLPSFFSATSNVDSHAINSLACGHRVIAVANLDGVRQRVAKTSSQGPTRDGRFKPDIAAPGTGIVAANGFAEPDKPWVAMSGTSMAAPYATGVIGLMLAVNSKLTAAQCSGILQRTSRPLPGGSYGWINDAGFGAIDAALAVREAASFSQRTDITKRVAE
jgi:subtilisin family serine protease